MSRVWNRLLPPTLGRHLVSEFLRMFALTVVAFVAISLVADFFDRFDDFLKHEATLSAMIRYFVFKIPFVIAQVTPVAVLVGALLAFGLLARQNEFVALRACGVSIWQIAGPLVVLSAVIAVAVFVWGETIVPYAARRGHEIERVEIKKRGFASVFTGREVWFHGAAGFYNINRVAMRRQTLYGLTVYQVGPDFRPMRAVEAASATWDGERWHFMAPRTRELNGAGIVELPREPEGFTLPETLADFQVVSVDAEEFSYGMLRRQIENLRTKGVDASESWVDLHLKIALPAASVIMMLLAIPLAVRSTRLTNLASGIGLGFVIGFAYFIVVAFSRALGQAGALPPLVAAWAANVVFALVAGYYMLGAD